MMMKMKQIFFIFVCVLFCVVSVRAKGITLHYNAYGAKMNLMSAKMEFEVVDGDFYIETLGRMKGLLKILLETESKFYSNGNISDNQFVVNNSYIETLRNDKYKKRQIDLRDKPDFIDYQTVLFQVMLLPQPQDKTFRVFDGKRELLLTFKYIGKTKLSKKSEMAYFGLADHYTLTIDIIKGKKKGWFFNRMGNKDNPPLHLYFTQVDGIKPKVMVKGEFNTALFGNIVVYLSRIDNMEGE